VDSGEKFALKIDKNGKANLKAEHEKITIIHNIAANPVFLPKTSLRTLENGRYGLLMDLKG